MSVREVERHFVAVVTGYTFGEAAASLGVYDRTITDLVKHKRLIPGKCPRSGRAKVLNREQMEVLKRALAPEVEQGVNE